MFSYNEQIEVVADSESDLYDKIQLYSPESLETGLMNWKKHYNLNTLFLSLL